ncbi:MAG: hypothetical protein ACFFFH_15910 [Candidatus Thorarchaeota archaeon]
MKELEPDARQLAKTYINNIEELLHSNSRLHVNEIDNLLSEINDFIHLRCRELSSREYVQYREVLEAINECGSPSEIVKQYLEINPTEIDSPFEPIKGKSAPLFHNRGINKLHQPMLTKVRTDKKSNKKNSLKSPHSELTPTDNMKYLTHSYFKKYEFKKKVETWIFISCISIIGLIWVPFLAFYWLISLKNAESNFIKSWGRNKAFSAIFPYQPEFHALFTQDKTYQTILHRINGLKTIFILFLIIPFYGYVILILGIGLISLYTLGLAPLLFYFYFKSPKRYINRLIEREYQLQSKESNNRNYLAFYNKSGYLSFDFDVTTQIMREFSLGETEKILGIFQTGFPLVRSKFIIVTNQKIFYYTPSIIFDYGERIRNLPKDKIDSYSFRKKGRRVTLIIKSVDRDYFLFRGIDKKIIEPIQNTLKLLELKHEKPVFTRGIEKKRSKNIVTPVESTLCQVCESQHSTTVTSLICDTCNRFVCIDCFYQRARSGKTGCPNCDGSLISY